MRNSKILTVFLVMQITGCASSAALDRSADQHAKAANYYASIGQPDTAREEHNAAKQDRDEANGFFAVLTELFNLLVSKDK